MLKECGLIEKYGSGIKRIRIACIEHGINEPVYENFQHGFKVTIRKDKGSSVINEGINFLYDYIKKNPSQRITHIEDNLKIPAKTIERWIKQLKKEGKIEYRGSKKTGGYYPVDK